MSLLDDHYKEINQHVRHVAQMLITWYTFFVAANLLAMGWFITADKKTVVIPHKVVWSLILLFIVVIILGIAALYAVRKYFAQENNRLQIYINKASYEMYDNDEFLSSPFPYILYKRATELASASLISIAIVWLALGFFIT